MLYTKHGLNSSFRSGLSVYQILRPHQNQYTSNSRAYLIECCLTVNFAFYFNSKVNFKLLQLETSTPKIIFFVACIRTSDNTVNSEVLRELFYRIYKLLRRSVEDLD